MHIAACEMGRKEGASTLIKLPDINMINIHCHYAIKNPSFGKFMISQIGAGIDTNLIIL
jgi:hypothetical protein